LTVVSVVKDAAVEGVKCLYNAVFLGPPYFTSYAARY
jgi:hypothetical protein